MNQFQSGAMTVIFKKLQDHPLTEDDVLVIHYNAMPESEGCVR